MPVNSVPWRRAACAINTHEYILSFKNMNFCGQPGFPGFFTAWESTPSLPLITTPEMDSSAHSQGNQDCRPFLYISSSVNGANTHGRVSCGKGDGTWSLQLQRPRLNKSGFMSVTLKQKDWPGSSCMAEKDAAPQRKKMWRADSRLQSCWNSWVHSTPV